MGSGSLVVVGTGIKFASHMTIESQAVIERAEKLLFLVNQPATAAWLSTRNPTAESLARFYAVGKARLDTYREMVDYILAFVRQGCQVCAVFYGHPGLFVSPSHEAVRQARREGFAARMLPGISAEDCLIADLGIDPAYQGCQSLDATDLLLRRRQLDTSSSLILWQVGVAGELSLQPTGNPVAGLVALTEILVAHYGAEHEGIIYEAAQYPAFDPTIRPVPLATLPSMALTPISTLYVPPKSTPPWDGEMLARLQIDPALLIWSSD